IIIDNSSSMYYPEANKGKIGFSIIAAGAIAYLLQRQRDAVGICTFSDKIELMTEIKSTSTHLNKIFTSLQELFNQNQVSKSTQVARILHEVAEKTHRRSLIVIFSDMFDNAADLDEIFSGLQHMKHNKHEVVLFHVTDKATEYDFDFEDRPHEFIDLESGERLKLQPYEVKEHYQQKAEEFYKNLKLRCAQLRIDFIEVDIAGDYNEILKAYLIKRAKMK
ncbi:MAG: VWA domain-containing protein, partial [Fulvivirga sp.]